MYWKLKQNIKAKTNNNNRAKQRMFDTFYVPPHNKLVTIVML